MGGGEGQGMVLRVGDAAGGQGVVAEGRDAGINMMPQENAWNGVSFAVHDAGGR